MHVSLAGFKIGFLEVRIGVGNISAHAGGVEDMQTGMPTMLNNWQHRVPEDFEHLPRHVQARFVKAAVMKLLEHEVEERLFIDGEPCFNPHPEVPG